MTSQAISESASSFGQLLHGHRTGADLTQRQIGELLDSAGYYVGVSAMTMWETGRRRPGDPALIHYLSTVLGLSQHDERRLLLALVADQIHGMFAAYQSAVIERGG